MNITIKKRNLKCSMCREIVQDYPYFIITKGRTYNLPYYDRNKEEFFKDNEKTYSYLNYFCGECFGNNCFSKKMNFLQKHGKVGEWINNRCSFCGEQRKYDEFATLEELERKLKDEPKFTFISYFPTEIQETKLDSKGNGYTELVHLHLVCSVCDKCSKEQIGI